MIALFTDFGWRGPYVGQVHAVFARESDAPPVIDLQHDAPRGNPHASAHLLAALAPRFPAGTIFVTVVDPGVGTDRRPLVVAADGRWFVGPDNGLLDIVSARATELQWWQIEQSPATEYATFHGRDLFAPVALRLARGEDPPGRPVTPAPACGADAEAGEVIYIDGFGNAMTGYRAPVDGERVLHAAGRDLPPGRTFADAAPSEALWLVNSVGLVEIAVNQGSAAERLGLSIGDPVHWLVTG